MSLNLVNSALLSADVLVDANKMFQSPPSVTPADLHALNSLIEAAVLHDTLYLFELPADKELGFDQLFQWGILEKEPIASQCERALEASGLTDVANDVLLDRYWGQEFVGYSSDTLVDTLEGFVEYEKGLGFAQMSRLLDSDALGERIATHAAGVLRFTPADVLAIDATYRRMRAAATVATELGLHLYTGLVSRPFVLDYFNVKRSASQQIFEQLKKEFDDWDASEQPEWRRIRVPALTQVVLQNCKDKPGAIANEIHRVRDQLQGFRRSMTEQTRALQQAKTRGEKLRIRRETDAALAAAMEKMQTGERLVHTVWDVVKNPLTAHQKIGDRFVAQDKLNQAVDKVHGLTDLYALLRDAPTLEQNTQLLRTLFQVECDARQWNRVQKVAQDLESLMRRDVEPTLPPQ